MSGCNSIRWNVSLRKVRHSHSGRRTSNCDERIIGEIMNLECSGKGSISGELLPPYSYVPGGPWPHPLSSRQGHSFGHRAPVPAADSVGGRSPSFLRGVELFNAGYYWEAHEAWEGLWHAYGRRGRAADVVKALIKLAAAGVKVREGREQGVRTHSRRAADLFATAAEKGGRHEFGLDLELWAKRAGEIAESPPQDPGPPGAPVLKVFAFRIELDRPQGSEE
jgi:hypothetical protein